MKNKSICLMTLGALIGSGQAVTTLIDFSSATPTPATAQGGNFWTGVDTTTATDLRNAADGSDTGWDITVTFNGGQVGFGGNGINGDGDVAPFDQSFAIIDGIFSSSPATTGFALISLTNLTPNTPYDFVAYTDRVSNWTAANGVIDTTVGTGPGSLVTPKDALTSFSIISDGSGSAAFTIAEGPTGLVSGDGIVLNVLSISSQPIPEPSTALLGGMAALGLMIRRKR